MRDLSVYQGHLLLAYAACPESTASEDERMRLVRQAGQSLVEAGAPLPSEAES